VSGGRVRADRERDPLAVVPAPAPPPLAHAGGRQTSESELDRVARERSDEASEPLDAWFRHQPVDLEPDPEPAGGFFVSDEQALTDEDVAALGEEPAWTVADLPARVVPRQPLVASTSPAAQVPPGPVAAPQAGPDPFLVRTRALLEIVDHHRRAVLALHTDIGDSAVAGLVQGVSNVMGTGQWAPPPVTLYDEAGRRLLSARDWHRHGLGLTAQAEVDAAQREMTRAHAEFARYFEQADLGAGRAIAALRVLEGLGVAAQTYLTGGAAASVRVLLRGAAARAGRSSLTVAVVGLSGAVGTGAVIGSAAATVAEVLRLAAHDVDRDGALDGTSSRLLRGALNGAADGLFAVVGLRVDKLAQVLGAQGSLRAAWASLGVRAGFDVVEGVVSAMIAGESDPDELLLAGVMSGSFGALVGPVLRALARARSRIQPGPQWRVAPPRTPAAPPLPLGQALQDLKAVVRARVAWKDVASDELERARAALAEELGRRYGAVRTGQVTAHGDLDVNFLEPGAMGKLTQARAWLRQELGAGDEVLDTALKMGLFPESKGLLAADLVELTGVERLALASRRPQFDAEADTWARTVAQDAGARSRRAGDLSHEISELWERYHRASPGEHAGLAERLYLLTAKRNRLLDDAYTGPGTYKAFVAWRDALGPDSPMTGREARAALGELRGKVRDLQAAFDAREAAGLVVTDRHRGELVSIAKQADRFFEVAEALGLRIRPEARTAVWWALLTKRRDLERRASPAMVDQFRRECLPELDRVLGELDRQVDALGLRRSVLEMARTVADDDGTRRP
jgi:hypothetical protein